MNEKFSVVKEKISDMIEDTLSTNFIKDELVMFLFNFKIKLLFLKMFYPNNNIIFFHL